MPIYAYACSDCGFAKDVLQKMSDPKLTQCPECGQETFEKQVTAAGFQLKGSGWYVTDFRDGGKSGKNSKPDGSSKSSESSDSSSSSSGEGSQATSNKATPNASDTNASETSAGSSGAGSSGAAAATPAASAGSEAA